MIYRDLYLIVLSIADFIANKKGPGKNLEFGGIFILLSDDPERSSLEEVLDFDLFGVVHFLARCSLDI